MITETFAACAGSGRQSGRGPWLLVPTRPGAWQSAGMQSVHEAAGGSEGLLRLAEAWHPRVMADEVVSHAFSHRFHPQHSRRLAAYWAEALGGPAAYSGACGDQTSVVRIHSGNGPHQEMDRQAIECFDQAIHDAGLEAAGPCGRSCTTTSPGPPPRKCPATPSLLTRFPTA
jgi:hemoglobin